MQMANEAFPLGLVNIRNGKAAFHDVVLSDEPVINNSGLALLGMANKISGLGQLKASTTTNSPKFSDGDCLAGMSAIMALGTPKYSYISNFNEDSHLIGEALLMSRGQMPSEGTLRQRLDQIAIDASMLDKVKSASIDFLGKVKYKVPLVEITDDNGSKQKYIRIDVDSSIFVNDRSKKELTSKGYTDEVGYNPLCAFLVGGVTVNGDLAPGSQNPLHEGFEQFFETARRNALRLVEDENCKVLWVCDAGFDADKLMQLIKVWGDKFIIKQNDRGHGWNDSIVECVKSNNIKGKEIDFRTTVYNGDIFTNRMGKDTENLRLVYEVTEESNIERPNQPRLFKFNTYTVFAVWTNINSGLSVSEILQMYRDRGTCEQYFSEIKTDLSAERFPSGKYATNQLIMSLIMYTVNVLRAVGMHLISDVCKGLKSVDRRRIQTTVRYFMYMPGRIVRHSRKIILKIHGCFQALSKAFRDCYVKFASLL